MVVALVDTNVVVDMIRKYPPSLSWLRTLPPKQIGITAIAYMEVIDGASNKVAQRAAGRLLSRFEIIYLTEIDFKWAMQQQSNYRLSHNISMSDILIASVHLRLQVPLYTRNLKHFTPLLGALAQKPY